MEVIERESLNKNTPFFLGAGLAGILVTLIAVFAPDKYALIPPGFEATVGGFFSATIGIIFNVVQENRLYRRAQCEAAAK